MSLLRHKGTCSQDNLYRYLIICIDYLLYWKQTVLVMNIRMFLISFLFHPPLTYIELKAVWKLGFLVMTSVCVPKYVPCLRCSNFFLYTQLFQKCHPPLELIIQLSRIRLGLLCVFVVETWDPKK